MERLQEHEIAEIGDYSESLMAQGHFNTLCAQFKQSAFDSMMATEPHENKRREAIYNEVWALQRFLGLMSQYVTERDQIRSRGDEAVAQQSTADENHP